MASPGQKTELRRLAADQPRKPIRFVASLCTVAALAIAWWHVSGSSHAFTRPIVPRITELPAVPPTAQVLDLPAIRHALPPADDSVPPAERTVEAAGRVLARSSDAGLPNHRVELRTGPDVATATTAPDGSFELDLPSGSFAQGRYAYAQVFSPTDESVFRGSVAVDRDMVVFVPSALWLTGTVTCAGVGLASGGQVLVSVPPAAPETGPGVVVRGSIGDGGRFRIRAHVANAPDLAQVRVLAPRQGLTGTAAVPFAELRSADGARIDLPAREIEFVVTDALSRPLPRVKIRLWRSVTRDLLERESDKQGSCRLRVPAGTWNWAAFDAGYHPGSGTVDVGRIETLRCTLAHVEQGRVVRGEVTRTAGGTPVAGAIVAAWPVEARDAFDDPGAFYPSFDRVTTDERGHFELRVPAAGRLCVAAAHRDLAPGPRLIVEDETSWVRIALRPGGDLIVSRTALMPEPASAGRTRCVLVDRQRHRVISWDGFPPLRIPRVPQGAYNVFLVSAEGGYGQASVLVAGDRETEVAVGTVPGGWFAGRVTDMSGAPAAHVEVVARVDGWTEDVSRWLGTTTTDRDGRFRVYAGLASSGAVEARTRDGRTWVQASVSRSAHIVLPDPGGRRNR